MERTFDKLEGKYHEVCYDLEGEVVFEKHPDLNDQSAHGKRGQARGEEANIHSRQSSGYSRTYLPITPRLLPSRLPPRRHRRAFGQPAKGARLAYSLASWRIPLRSTLDRSPCGPESQLSGDQTLPPIWVLSRAPSGATYRRDSCRHRIGRWASESTSGNRGRSSSGTNRDHIRVSVRSNVLCQVMVDSRMPADA